MSAAGVSLPSGQTICRIPSLQIRPGRDMVMAGTVFSSSAQAQARWAHPEGHSYIPRANRPKQEEAPPPP